MGSIWYWLLAALVFGILSGALYTWMSPRRSGWKWLLVRSIIFYTLPAVVLVYILFVFL